MFFFLCLVLIVVLCAMLKVWRKLCDDYSWFLLLEGINLAGFVMSILGGCLMAWWAARRLSESLKFNCWETEIRNCYSEGWWVSLSVLSFVPYFLSSAFILWDFSAQNGKARSTAVSHFIIGQLSNPKVTQLIRTGQTKRRDPPGNHASSSLVNFVVHLLIAQ